MEALAPLVNGTAAGAPVGAAPAAAAPAAAATPEFMRAWLAKISSIAPSAIANIARVAAAVAIISTAEDIVIDIYNRKTNEGNSSFVNVKYLHINDKPVDKDKLLNFYMDSSFIQNGISEYPSTWNPNTGKMLEAYDSNRGTFFERLEAGEFKSKK